MARGHLVNRRPPQPSQPPRGHRDARVYLCLRRNGQGMARLMTRRVALAALGTLAAGSVLGLGYAYRSIFGIVESPAPDVGLANGPGDGGMTGVGAVDMRAYLEMFSRHTEINRVVEEIPGGVRT